MRAAVLVLCLATASACEPPPPDPAIPPQIRGDAFRHTSELDASDDTIPSGEYIEAFAIDARPGQTIRARVESAAFAPYLMINAPEGEPQSDFAAEAAGTVEGVVEADTAGVWSVRVTTAEPGQTGAYRVSVDVTGGEAVPIPAELRTYAETLSATDETLESGEYADVYSFRVQPGDRIIADMRSQELDPYIIVTRPGMESNEGESDDYYGDQTRSRVDATFTTAGRVNVLFTSHAVGEKGAYVASIQHMKTGE